MSEKVTAFWPVEIGRFKYLFFVANWNDYSSSITESLEKNLEIFGKDLALKGKVIQSYKEAKGQTFEEVKTKKDWPYDVRARFDSELYPFMLIINEGFERFDPQANEWSIVWFSDFRDNPNSISEIFGTLLKRIRENENLFDYFKALAKKQASKKFIGYFEMKPGIAGFSVDVKAILADFVGSIKKRSKR